MDSESNCEPFSFAVVYAALKLACLAACCLAAAQAPQNTYALSLMGVAVGSAVAACGFCASRVCGALLQQRRLACMGSASKRRLFLFFHTKFSHPEERLKQRERFEARGVNAALEAA